MVWVISKKIKILKRDPRLLKLLVKKDLKPQWSSWLMIAICWFRDCKISLNSLMLWKMKIKNLKMLYRIRICRLLAHHSFHNRLLGLLQLLRNLNKQSIIPSLWKMSLRNKIGRLPSAWKHYSLCKVNYKNILEAKCQWKTSFLWFRVRWLRVSCKRLLNIYVTNQTVQSISQMPTLLKSILY